MKYLFSIRNKIFVCFMIPILFMILVGYAAYRQAAEGMREKYQESTLQTVKMVTEHIDMSDTFIEAEGTKYVVDKDLNNYFLGLYKSDPIGKMNLLTNTKTQILSAQVTNPFISNIHIVTKEEMEMITTQKSGCNGFFASYQEAMSDEDGKLQRWVDRHEALDEYLKLNEEDYITSFQMLSQSRNAVIVVDISTEAIREFLSGLELGSESIVGLVTETGREIICEKLPEGKESILKEGEKVFSGQEFFNESSAAKEAYGVKQVKYAGEDYLYFYSESEVDHTTVCSLIPLRIVTGQAEAIKGLTVGLVILACVIAISIGILISVGIQNNVKQISCKLGEVAKGNLTVQIKAKGRDEFRELAASAANMIKNNKKLVTKVEDAAGQLEVSAQEVKEASDVISNYSTDITRAIDEINEGMSRQSKHAQGCVERTDELSKEMKAVSSVVEKVENLVSETEEMIEQGMRIVQNLGCRAKETTVMTAKVGESIGELRKKSEMINEFVHIITEISSQTNLLSLNASIEAARAGSAGRGFAVVAEEIRKLADDSARAASEISNNVKHISSQTNNSVESAKQAEEMVILQTEAVEEVIAVFDNMNERMIRLVNGLNNIVESMERADRERKDTLEAVRNISEIIDETAAGTEVVHDIARKLMKNVEKLSSTSDALGDNMESLVTEISVFRTE